MSEIREIIGNTTSTPNPQADWWQESSTKPDYIKNKPTLGAIASKDRIAKNDLTSDVQATLDKADSAMQGYTETDPTVPEWAKAATKPTYTADEVGAIPASYKGAANGVAELDENGKVPSAQLPSYVDDVLEYDSKTSFPTDGESGKIYIDTSTNITYRWSGTVYTAIGSDLALGETSSSAYRGDRGKTAYDHSQVTSGNPHGVSKSDVGLGDVDNKSSATIRGELTKENVTNALGYTPPKTVPTKMSELENDTGYLTQADAPGSAEAVQVNLDKHVDNTNNPHGVTKAQIGLDSVDNTADVDKPVSTAQELAIADAKQAGTDAQANLNVHTGNTSNPHSVSLTQLGVTVTAAELNYVGGVTSGIQEQLDAKANQSDIPNTTEQWIFTLEDGTTVPKVVYVG